MGEYKRWISYIYSYDRGIKSVNTGYVRIESRNGKCRMTVNIKGGLSQGDSLTMYLFYRDGADMIMVYAGEGEFYDGVCEFIGETLCHDVFGSGKDINEMGGVIAYSTLDKFYGTEWDDKPILLRRIIEHDSVLPGPQVIPAPVVEPGPEILPQPIEMPQPEMPQPDLSHPSEMPSPQVEPGPQEIPFPLETGEQENVDEDNISVENINMENDELNENSSLYRIFSKMPGMYPFEDDDIIECVKFEPQDIGIFPMDKWILASNSFLLHGYYTYRHLIFARRRTKEGTRCMLGVPGMFRDREKFMAGMFGFGNFKSVRGKKTPGYGEFGYWYMDIDMPEAGTQEGDKGVVPG